MRGSRIGLSRFVLGLALVPGAATGRAEDLAVASQSAALCRIVPPSVNPWAGACTPTVAKRWTECASVAATSARWSCLGFKRPARATGAKATAALAHVRSMCKTTPAPINTMGPRCEREVTERFAWCGPPFLAREISSEAFARCEGFEVPEEDPEDAAKVAGCEGAKLRVRLAISVGNEVVVSERDVSALRLLSDGRVEVTLIPPATKRLADATAAHVGENATIVFAGTKLSPRIESALTGGILSFNAAGRGLAEFCSQ